MTSKQINCLMWDGCGRSHLISPHLPYKTRLWAVVASSIYSDVMFEPGVVQKVPTGMTQNGNKRGISYMTTYWLDVNFERK